MKRRGFTIIEVAIVIAVFLVLVIILAPFARIAKMRANRIDCAGNLMQISLALHSYAAEHNGKFPQNLGELYPNYIRDEKVFNCPASRKPGTKESPDYDYTAGLNKRSTAKTIIVKDTAANHKKSGENVLMVDGTITWEHPAR